MSSSFSYNLQNIIVVIVYSEVTMYIPIYKGQTHNMADDHFMQVFCYNSHLNIKVTDCWSKGDRYRQVPLYHVFKYHTLSSSCSISKHPSPPSCQSSRNTITENCFLENVCVLTNVCLPIFIHMYIKQLVYKN